jgi:hypothetical protein
MKQYCSVQHFHVAFKMRIATKTVRFKRLPSARARPDVIVIERKFHRVTNLKSPTFKYCPSGIMRLFPCVPFALRFFMRIFFFLFRTLISLSTTHETCTFNIIMYRMWHGNWFKVQNSRNERRLSDPKQHHVLFGFLTTYLCVIIIFIYLFFYIIDANFNLIFHLRWASVTHIITEINIYIYNYIILCSKCFSYIFSTSYYIVNMFKLS